MLRHELCFRKSPSAVSALSLTAIGDVQSVHIEESGLACWHVRIGLAGVAFKIHYPEMK
jgi:hypothetical protein